MSSESKCPFHHAAGGGTTNKDWWPKQLKVELLNQHSSKSDPMGGDFDYSEEFNSLDLAAVKKDLAALMTDSRDVGAFIAHVFTTPGHDNKSYDVSSPDLLSFHQVAEIFTRELGRPVQYVPQDPVAYKAFLGKFITSQWHLDAVCDIFAEISRGYMAQTTNTFREVTGREPVGLAQFIREFASAFRA